MIFKHNIKPSLALWILTDKHLDVHAQYGHEMIYVVFGFWHDNQPSIFWQWGGVQGF